MRFWFGFRWDERAAAMACYATNLKDTERFVSGRMDVQGGCGVHGVASLCGERVRQKLTYSVNKSRKVNLEGIFRFCGGLRGVHALPISFL